MRTLFILSIAFFALSSCKKDNPALIGEWEVVAIRASENADWENAPETIEFIFEEKQKMSIGLSVNRCNTSFSSCTCGSMVINAPSCTEACCDSEFSLRILDFITEINAHEIDNDELILKGGRYIKLQRRK
jgi:hypothetical protein